jgi:hypothetical protein
MTMEEYHTVTYCQECIECALRQASTGGAQVAHVAAATEWEYMDSIMQVACLLGVRTFTCTLH